MPADPAFTARQDQVRCDAGTEYAQVLTAARHAKPADITEPQLLALFCEYTMQRMAGAFSPRLVWEGARKRGMTEPELREICARKDLAALDNLQFS